MDDDIMFRVEDESSQAHTTERGVLASVESSGLTFKLGDEDMREEFFWALHDHVRWSSDAASPFISVYSDWDTALREAQRRVRMGKQHVTITVIDGSPDRDLDYRRVRGLASRLGLDIPSKAWNNSKFEIVFLHRIPPHAIVEVILIEDAF